MNNKPNDAIARDKAVPTRDELQIIINFVREVGKMRGDLGFVSGNLCTALDCIAHKSFTEGTAIVGIQALKVNDIWNRLRPLEDSVLKVLEGK